MLWQWQTFCDFKEITDISIKRICHEQVPHDSRMVTIIRRDDACLVRDAPNPGLCHQLHCCPDFKSCTSGHFWFSNCRRWSSRAWRKRCHSCHWSMATSDWRQTPPTTSATTPLLRVSWRASKTTVTVQSREELWHFSCLHVTHVAQVKSGTIKRSNQIFCNLSYQAKPTVPQWLITKKTIELYSTKSL